MDLEELAPVNTKRAKATAVAAFMRFLKAEGVPEEYVRACIERDESGKCFVSVMDKFCMHLAFNEGKNGKPLARNTSMQYYRQAKIWLLDQFPQHRASLETRLLKMGKTIDSFCMKRDGGGFISKAPPCTKVDLKRLLVYLYVNASCSSDYQDAALLCLLWHLFGRASDLALLRKPNVSIDAGNVLFVRYIRMKTSEEQGLSLFAGTEFETCPMLAMALAPLMQTAPSPSVIDNLPETPDQAAISLSPDVSLLEVLDHPADTTGLGVPSTTGVATTPTVYSHVNRVLDRITVAAGVDATLTSHSFRRGGAQHANGSGELTARWIFDRGAWNMSTTNKGFNYIFNTSKEDHKVSNILSGHDADAKVVLQNLVSFDSHTRSVISSFQHHLFNTRRNLQEARHNVNQAVLDVLTSTVIRHYPLLKNLNAEAPAVKRIDACVAEAGCSLEELLAWSSHLASSESVCEELKPQCTTQPPSQALARSAEQKIIDHQATVINHFIEHVKLQDARMDALEAKLNDPTQVARKRHKQESSTSELWRAPISRQQKSDAKQLVAYMKLFLDDGFVLDATAEDFRDKVLQLGTRAEKAVLAFLDEHGIISRGSGAVLKHLRTLHRAGTLNARIERHEQLLQSAAICDPAPGYTQNVLEQISG
ncbi:hypothetical protein AM587_10001254 [Phytophthora nicotianae]|uniref:Uncharacterized protein n=1 Tax=Phytophthora nicotianae TaxID=4792 RepID=A0A0W8CMB6_PHYNI|nr:hypothetical protein AM587_10001254 [Phytophthora nicotianae]